MIFSIQKIKNLFSKFHLFHYLLIFLLGIILVFITTSVFFLLKSNNLQNQDKSNISDKVIYISLGEEFKLKKEQVAILGDNLLEIRILDFIYSPCPEGAQCIWSGLGIIFEFTNANGEKITQMTSTFLINNTFGFKIEVKDSDYNTYAILKVKEVLDKNVS